MFNAHVCELSSEKEELYRKSELQMFLLISGGHFGGPKLSTNMASPYKGGGESYTKVCQTFRQITQKLCATIKTCDLDKLFIY